MNEPKKIIALRCALLIAKRKAEEIKNKYDGGTCNFDIAYIVLKNWKESEVWQAFKFTGMRPNKDENGAFLIVDYENFPKGLRRTAMAEALSDSLKEQGYVAGVIHPHTERRYSGT